jgi:hypothetical protein
VVALTGEVGVEGVGGGGRLVRGHARTSQRVGGPETLHPAAEDVMRLFPVPGLRPVRPWVPSGP